MFFVWRKTKIERHTPVKVCASIWLSTLPLKDEGYCLNKQEFWDLVWDFALYWKKGGFITLTDNHIRIVTADLLSQVTKHVKIEPLLQSLTGETFVQWTANTSGDAQLDISSRGFWTKYQMAFFDVMVFDVSSKRYSARSLQRCFINNEKKRSASITWEFYE